MAALLQTLLTDAARRFPDRVAVLADAPLTYAALERAAGAFARRLAAAGVTGGRVGLLLPNLPLFPAVLHGILRRGASAVMLNPLYSSREVAEYLRDSTTRVVVTTAKLASMLPEGVLIVTVDDEWTGDRTEVGTEVPPAPAPEADDEAVVIYTAAMGGWARGARLTHRSLGANLRSTVEAMQVTADDRVLALLPLIHAFGLTVAMNAPLAVGAVVIPVERFHPVRVLDALAATRATVISGVPAMFVAIVAAAERRGVPDHALRLVICGGAPLPPGLAERWESLFGVPLREGYGLTEGSPVCLFSRTDRPNRPGTLGYPFPGVDVTVRSGDGSVLPAGETGEICVEGENVFAGYVREDGRDPRDFHDGAFRTGDAGVMEVDGAVRFAGFLKPMFTRSGFNIYPRELERVICEDPRIARAEVRAIPDALKENEIALVVTPVAGADLDEAAVREICLDCLAQYKQPATITLRSADG